MHWKGHLERREQACEACGHPVNTQELAQLRREADWRGVRLCIQEKYFVAAVVGAANAIAAAVALVLS